MIHLVIRVIGTDKWVTVEDLSGPTIRFNGHVKAQPEDGSFDNDVVVEIHSTPSRPGRAVVYAGRRENDRSARFYCENLTASCIVKIQDGDLLPRIEDSAGFADCRCVNIMPAREEGAEERAGRRSREKATGA